MFQNRDASYAITWFVQYLVIECTLASTVEKIDRFLLADGTLTTTHSNENRVSSWDSGCGTEVNIFKLGKNVFKLYSKVRTWK